MPTGKEAKEIIQNEKSMGKTRRFIPVVLDIKSDSQLIDIYELAEL